MSTHVHNPAFANMYFDTADEADAWAKQYRREQGRKGNQIGAAWGVSECPCGKLYINGFR